MYLEVYPDLIFILNFFYDLVLLLIVKKINRNKSTRLRLIAASALGGLVAVLVSMFIWMHYLLRFFLMYILASVFMILIAFGKGKVSDLIKQVILLNIISFLAGGLINAVYYHSNFRLVFLNLGRGIVLSNISYKLIVLMFSLFLPLVVILLYLKRWYEKNRPLIYKVDLVYGENKITANGLMDTGNCLYDPILQKPVILIEDKLIESLVTPEFYKDIHKIKESQDESQWDFISTDLSKLRFIPYKSVGKSGILLAIKLDELLIYTERETICNEKVIAAISDNSLSTKDIYQVILHRELINL